MSNTSTMCIQPHPFVYSLLPILCYFFIKFTNFMCSEHNEFWHMTVCNSSKQQTLFVHSRRLLVTLGANTGPTSLRRLSAASTRLQVNAASRYGLLCLASSTQHYACGFISFFRTGAGHLISLLCSLPLYKYTILDLSILQG